MQICSPSEIDVQHAFDIELDYNVGHEQHLQRGFFLPGATLELYNNLSKSGFMRVVKDDTSGVIGFIIVVPPRHDVITRLFTNNESMVIFDGNLKQRAQNTIWIAKVAVREESVRQGVASKLYAAARNAFKDVDVFTATALSPIRNAVSEEFHRAIGMRAVGIFLGGDKLPLRNTVNTVWHCSWD